MARSAGLSGVGVRDEEVEANPEAPVRVDHMVVEAIDDHRAVVGRRQHERDFAALMVRHWSHAQPEQRPQNHFSSYRVWIVDFAPSFFDMTSGGKHTNASSCR